MSECLQAPAEFQDGLGAIGSCTLSLQSQWVYVLKFLNVFIVPCWGRETDRSAFSQQDPWGMYHVLYIPTYAHLDAGPSQRAQAAALGLPQAARKLVFIITSNDY
jgi:hypothetical protein